MLLVGFLHRRDDCIYRATQPRDLALRRIEGTVRKIIDTYWSSYLSTTTPDQHSAHRRATFAPITDSHAEQTHRASQHARARAAERRETLVDCESSRERARDRKRSKRLAKTIDSRNRRNFESHEINHDETCQSPPQRDRRPVGTEQRGRRLIQSRSTRQMLVYARGFESESCGQHHRNCQKICGHFGEDCCDINRGEGTHGGEGEGNQSRAVFTFLFDGPFEND